MENTDWKKFLPLIEATHKMYRKLSPHHGGGRCLCGCTRIEGVAENVMFFDRALSPTEVRQLYTDSLEEDNSTDEQDERAHQADHGPQAGGM